MADEFPPLRPLPESNIPSSLLTGQLAHAAQWANTFGGQDTNLVQRYRHNQDLTDYAQALAEQRAQAQAESIQKSQVAQNLYFNTLKLDQAERQAQQRMKFAADLHPLKMAVEQERLEATGAAEKRKAMEAATEFEHTKNLNNGLIKLYASGVPRHSTEFKDAAADLISQFPSADAKHIMELGKLGGFTQAATPEEVIDQAVAKKKALMAVQPPGKQGDSLAQFDQDLKSAVEHFGGPDKVRPEVWEAFEKRKAKLLATPGSANGGAPAQAQPATPSFLPGTTATKNGITYVRGDDGKWLPKQ